MQAMFYRYITQFGPFGERFSSVWHQFGSENRDVVEQTSCYLASETLAGDALYADKIVPGNISVAELAKKWEGFIYEWLGEHARRGPSLVCLSLAPPATPLTPTPTFALI